MEGLEPKESSELGELAGAIRSRIEDDFAGAARIWLADDGDVFVADVGEMCVEEVTRLDGETVGQDLGWNHLEGDRVFDTDSRHDERTPVPPVITWTHATGSCAVVGGTEYLGDIAELRGAQIVGDLCTGDLYAVFDDRIGQIPVRLHSPVDVTIGADGELWVIDMAVGVRRITRRPVAP